MRVGFFGQSGPYAPVALRTLAGAGQRGFHLAVVVEGRKTPVASGDHRWHAPAPGPVMSGERLRPLAAAMGLPVLETCDVNAPWVVQQLAAFDLDVIVCVGFDRLFRRELVQVARHGGINAHPSELPRFRGPCPLFWMARHGVRESAVTLHAIDAREDHGNILAQQPFVVAPHAAGDANYRVAGALAGRMLARLLEDASKDPRALEGRPQIHALATRAPRPSVDDAYVSPATWGAEHLVHFACAAPYFQTPWTILGDETFRFYRGYRATLGRRLPAQYVLQRKELAVQARDGIAHLEVR